MRRQQAHARRGFTLTELIAVILLIAILGAVALPRFLNVSREARIAALNGIAGAMRATSDIVQASARAQGLRPTASNPGDQSRFLIDVEGRSVELDWRNLCPESVGELGDRLTMLDFVRPQMGSGMTSQLNNRYTLVGFDIPGFSVPTNQGCYVIYDSFGDPDCTSTVVTVDC